MRKTLLVRLSAAAVLSLGAWVAYTQTPQAPPTNRLEKVKDDLYAIIGDGGNVAVYITDDGVILIDDKFERDYDDIMAKVKSVTNKPIKYILNTHQHGDHTGGNEKIRGGSSGVEVIAHKNARANMVTQKLPGLAQVTFSDETQVFLGGKEVRAHYFGRGHTNGDVMIYFPADRVLHTGDLFTVPGAPLPNANAIAPFIDFAGGGSAVDWPGTLDNLMKQGWDFDTVIPGHGPVSKPADLVSYRERFGKMRTRMTSVVKGAKSMEEVVKTLVSDFGWASDGNGMRQVDAFIAELKNTR